MTSGQWITYFLLGALVAFIIWEFIQLARGKETMSQYVIRRAKEGSGFWRLFILIFPFFVIAVGIWLVPHWEGLCINFGVLCGIDV